MPIHVGPWDTRSVTVPGHNAFNLPQTLLAGYYDHQATVGASVAGSSPWRADSLRIATADAAKESTVPSARLLWSQPDLDMTAYPGARQRSEYIELLCGLKTDAIADRVLLGSFFDDYSVHAYLGNAFYGVDPRWLSVLFPIPDPSAVPSSGAAVPLSTTEWVALWDRDINIDPDITEFRHIDLSGCHVAAQVTFTLVDTSHETGGAPGFTVKLDAGAALFAQYRQGSIIYALPDVETISGTPRAVPFTNPNWRDAVSGVDIGKPVIDSSTIDLVTQATAAVDGGDEYVVPDSGVWDDGFDPGYDESGIPFGPASSAVYDGGPAADWYAVIRVQINVTYTIKQQFITVFDSVTPPLHQRQRAGGVFDSHASFAASAGRGTRQSSYHARGML